MLLPSRIVGDVCAYVLREVAESLQQVVWKRAVIGTTEVRFVTVHSSILIIFVILVLFLLIKFLVGCPSVENLVIFLRS